MDDPKSILVVSDENIPAPPISILSLSIRATYTRTSISDVIGQHEILLASCLHYPSINIERMEETVKCGGVFNMVKPVNVNGFSNKFMEQLCRLQKGKLNVCRTERALLQSINEIIAKCDPDVLLGHDFAGFTLPVLAQRMKNQRIENVQLGRLAFKQWPKGSGTGPNSTGGAYADRQLISGRLLMDTYLSAKVGEGMVVIILGICQSKELFVGSTNRNCVEYEEGTVRLGHTHQPLFRSPLPLLVNHAL